MTRPHTMSLPSFHHPTQLLTTVVLLVTTLLLLGVIIPSPLPCAAHLVANSLEDGFLFSKDPLPFTLQMKIRIGLVGFSSDSVPAATVNAGSLSRSLMKTLHAYRPKNIDDGKHLSAQYGFVYDVFHVDTADLHKVEEFLASSLSPSLDIFGTPIRLNDPSKSSSTQQQQQQQQQQQGKPSPVDTTSPFYTAAIPQIDIGLADILLESLRKHLKLPAGGSNGGASAFDADKEYSVFILNPSIERIVQLLRRRQQQQTTTGKPLPVENRIVYGYINRTPQDIVYARSAGLTSGAFASFVYTNNWVGHGRWIIADVKSLSSVNTNLDGGDGYMEEILATIYRQLYDGHHGPGAAGAGRGGGYSQELLNVGLLGQRAQEQASLRNELTIYNRVRDAGSIKEVLRSNTIVPSLLDPNSLAELSITAGSTAYQQQQQRMKRMAASSPHQQQHRALSHETIATTVTPMLASYIASAVRGVIATDITTPPPLASIISIPVLILADHSHQINPEDIIDLTSIQKLVNKVAVNGHVKITPIVHNIHTFPSVSSALYGSITPIYVERDDTSRGPRYIVNGDHLSLALYKASLTNPLLASMIPSKASATSLHDDFDLTLEDIVNDSYQALRMTNVALSEIGGGSSNIFKAKQQHSMETVTPRDASVASDATKKGSTQQQHHMRTTFDRYQPYTLPVVVLSLTSLPQPSTVAYPQTQGKRHGIITVLHDINRSIAASNTAAKEMLKKQLTISIIADLLQRLTGVIPPHIRYEMVADPPQQGLFWLDTPASTSLSVATSTASRYVAPPSGSSPHPAQNYLADAGAPLVEFIDSTFSMGLHPFSPYSTLYKVTKIYRDNSRRNALIHFIHMIMRRSRVIVAKTCDVVHQYGFLASAESTFGFNIDDIGAEIFLGEEDSDATFARRQQVDNEILQMSDTGDILEYFVDQGVLLDHHHGDCLLPFSPLPTPSTSKTDLTEEERIQAVLTSTQTLPHVPMDYRVHLYQRTAQHLKDAGVTSPDDRVVLYLMNHPNAPPLVLFELLAMANHLTMIETQLFYIQGLLDHPSRHGSYAQLWQSVFDTVGRLITRITHLAQRSVTMRKELKMRYSACRVVQRFQGQYLDNDADRTFRGYAHDSDEGPKFSTLGGVHDPSGTRHHVHVTSSRSLNPWNVAIVCLVGAVVLTLGTVAVLLWYSDDCLGITSTGDDAFGVYKKKTTGHMEPSGGDSGDGGSSHRHSVGDTSNIADREGMRTSPSQPLLSSGRHKRIEGAGHDHDHFHPDNAFSPASVMEPNPPPPPPSAATPSALAAMSTRAQVGPARTWEAGFHGPSPSSLSPQDFRPHHEPAPRPNEGVRSPVKVSGYTAAVISPSTVTEPVYDALLTSPQQRQMAQHHQQQQQQPQQPPAQPLAGVLSPMAATTTAAPGARLPATLPPFSSPNAVFPPPSAPPSSTTSASSGVNPLSHQHQQQFQHPFSPPSSFGSATTSAFQPPSGRSSLLTAPPASSRSSVGNHPPVTTTGSTGRTNTSIPLPPFQPFSATASSARPFQPQQFPRPSGGAVGGTADATSPSRFPVLSPPSQLHATTLPTSHPGSTTSSSSVNSTTNNSQQNNTNYSNAMDPSAFM